MPELAQCVFCGRPIGSDEDTTGRPPMAAHAACADAALASDRHWDAINASSGGTAEESREPTSERRSAGCLALVCVLAVTAVAATLGAIGLATPFGGWLAEQSIPSR